GAVTEPGGLERREYPCCFGVDGVDDKFKFESRDLRRHEHTSDICPVLRVRLDCCKSGLLRCDLLLVLVSLCYLLFKVISREFSLRYFAGDRLIPCCFFRQGCFRILQAAR